MNDESRMDGRQLVAPPVEPGSDALLSPEVRQKIAEIVQHWTEDPEHRSLRERIHDRLHDDASPADPS